MLYKPTKFLIGINVYFNNPLAQKRLMCENLKKQNSHLLSRVHFQINNETQNTTQVSITQNICSIQLLFLQFPDAVSYYCADRYFLLLSVTWVVWRIVENLFRRNRRISETNQITTAVSLRFGIWKRHLMCGRVFRRLCHEHNRKIYSSFRNG